MQKVWQLRKRTESNLIKQLLASRGIDPGDPQQVESFLNPQYQQLHSPFLFSEMSKAVERIWQAIDQKEKILIYSDYDADAVTANALLFRALKLLGAEPEVYIPDRFTEGYGLNLEAFVKIRERGVDLVITVDCGSNSIDEARFCKEHGIDLVITDHHEITGPVPQCLALINPKKPNEAYPYRELTGVGVAFKLVSALFSHRQGHFPPNRDDLPDGFEKWFLDLAAIGTVADCHSLLGENRIIVKYGLQVLEKTRWIGLKYLMGFAGFNSRQKPLDTYSIGFIIAPRINAAGRVEHAGTAFQLLVSDDKDQVLELARQLEQFNSKRQMLTENVMSEARAQILPLEQRKVLLAVGNDWPKGVVGLVAGKLAEEFARPVLVLERGQEQSTGSARSIPNFNIIEALSFSKGVLVKYGGHAAAAGFTLKTEHIDIFYKNLLDYADRNLLEADLAKTVEIDAEVSVADINLATAETVENFQPFGVDNLKPKFLLLGARIEETYIVGKDRAHLQMTVSVNNGGVNQAAGRKFFKCIAFNFGRIAEQFEIGQRIDIVFEMLLDIWNGSKNIKLKIVDFRKAL